MSDSNGIKVLIVEDNKMNMTLLRDILSLNGYEIIEALNGAEGIGLVAEKTPDIVLMDLHLPGMDGITATRILKADERFKDIPVLAITASATNADKERIIASGFDGCVTKPIVREVLLGELRRFTGHKNVPVN